MKISPGCILHGIHNSHIIIIHDFPPYLDPELGMGLSPVLGWAQVSGWHSVTVFVSGQPQVIIRLASDWSLASILASDWSGASLQVSIDRSLSRHYNNRDTGEQKWSPHSHYATFIFPASASFDWHNTHTLTYSHLHRASEEFVTSILTCFLQLYCINHSMLEFLF